MTLAEHTFDEACPACPSPHGVTSPDGWHILHPPGRCDLGTYSATFRRFLQVPRHLEAYVTAYYNPDVAAGAHELARLEDERRNLPRGHSCSEPGGCPSENAARGIPACPTCRARRARQVSQTCDQCSQLARQARPKDCQRCLALGGLEFGAELGRTARVEAPMPSTLLLDYFGRYM